MSVVSLLFLNTRSRQVVSGVGEMITLQIVCVFQLLIVTYNSSNGDEDKKTLYTAGGRTLPETRT